MGSLILALLLQGQGERVGNRTFKTPEQLQREASGPRFSLGYVPLGWRRLVPADRAFAEAQAERFQRQDERTKERTTLLSCSIERLGRREVLGAMVAIQAGMSLGRQPENRLFARADVWRKDYSATEYKWRTLAHWGIQHDLGLVPAYQRLLSISPNDWRVEVGYISALLSKRQDSAVTRARRLAARYPKHFGSQEVLAHTLSIRAWQTKNRAMHSEAIRVLDAARSLIASDADRRIYEDRRQTILQTMKE